MASAAPITGAPTCAPATSPFRLAQARYRAAVERFNALPFDIEIDDPDGFKREYAALAAATVEVDMAPTNDWHEFAASFAIICDNGESEPNREALARLFADSQRLAQAQS